MMDASSSLSAQDLIAEFATLVGAHHTLTHEAKMRPYSKGYRFGGGKVLAVVMPGSLVEQWRVLKACISAGVIVIMQAANTGLTGGSTPDGDSYDRDIVIINTRRMADIQLLNDGKQVVAFPGATLNTLEKTLKPLGREPHSVLGSSCVGASIVGGVCNNSGGALVRRGPVYTELALFARLDAEGKLKLVNHLGIELGDDPESILNNLQNANYRVQDVDNDATKKASNHDYAEEVRKVDEPSAARFNNNPKNLFEASGSAGKLVIFAVRLDTFATQASEVFYIASKDADDLTQVRRHMLTKLEHLPIAGEYLDHTAFAMGEKYGKDTFLIVKRMGTERIPKAFAFKSRMDGWLEKVGIKHFSDKFLQLMTNMLPQHLPKFMYQFQEKYQHHLIVRVVKEDAPALASFLHEYFSEHTEGSYHRCNDKEGAAAFLHRFATSGAGARFKNTHAKLTDGMVALDIALRRDDRAWVEKLPAELEDKLVRKLYYGHFFCHVFHQIYVLKKGVNALDFEHAMWKELDKRGAEYPAEHNVGHLYIAKPALREFYQTLDPENRFNPGIGHTSKYADWQK